MVDKFYILVSVSIIIYDIKLVSNNVMKLIRITYV